MSRVGVSAAAVDDDIAGVQGAGARAAQVTVRYFASLRDRAGSEVERVTCPASLAGLYDALSRRHGFALGREQVRVAVNGDFVDWSCVPAAGDEVVFIPPVSGG